MDNSTIKPPITQPLQPSQLPVSPPGKTNKPPQDDLKDIIANALSHEQSTENSPFTHTTKPLNEQEITEVIEISLEQCEENYLEIRKIQEEVAQNSNIYSVTGLVQMGVADFILKGGSASAQAGLSMIVQSPDLLADLEFSVPIIKAATDIIDVNLGTIGLIYQYRMVQAGREELEKMSKMALDPEQRARLDKLGKILELEDELVLIRGLNQTLRGAQNTFNSLRILATQSSAASANALCLGLGGMVFGIQSLIYARLFSQASNHLNNFVHWTKNLKDWVEDHTHMNVGTGELNALLETRMARESERREKLVKKLTNNKISLAEVKIRVENVKTEGFQNFIQLLGKQAKLSKLSEEAWIGRLEERIGASLNLNQREICQQVYRLQIQEPSTENEELKDLKTSLASDCAAVWLSNQSDDSVISAYLDHQAVIDSTVKIPLANIISQKHELEEKFLHLETMSTSTQMVVTGLLAAVLISLAIVSFAVTPIGPVSLIVIGCMVISGLFAVGFLITGTYFAYKQRPELTSALLKGAYLKLFYYYARAATVALGDYLSILADIKKSDLIQFFRKHIQASTPESETSIEENNPMNISQYAEWMKKAELYQEELDRLAWEDFANQTASKISKDSFDTLSAFTKALSETDTQLLSDELKDLIEKQLGIDLSTLQMEAAKNPSAVKKLVRKFFILRDADYTKFLRQQTALYNPSRPPEASPA